MDALDPRELVNNGGELLMKVYLRITNLMHVELAQASYRVPLCTTVGVCLCVRENMISAISFPDGTTVIPLKLNCTIFAPSSPLFQLKIDCDWARRRRFERKEFGRVWFSFI